MNGTGEKQEAAGTTTVIVQSEIVGVSHTPKTLTANEKRWTVNLGAAKEGGLIGTIDGFRIEYALKCQTIPWMCMRRAPHLPHFKTHLGTWRRNAHRSTGDGSGCNRKGRLAGSPLPLYDF